MYDHKPGAKAPNALVCGLHIIWMISGWCWYFVFESQLEAIQVDVTWTNLRKENVFVICCTQPSNFIRSTFMLSSSIKRKGQRMSSNQWLSLSLILQRCFSCGSTGISRRSTTEPSSSDCVVTCIACGAIAWPCWLPHLGHKRLWKCSSTPGVLSHRWMLITLSIFTLNELN